MAANNSSKKLKQGNLFSFFNKTKVTEKICGNNSSNSRSETQMMPLGDSPRLAVSGAALVETPVKQSNDKSPPDKLKLGQRIEIYWADDDEYYVATVQKQQAQKFFVQYELDGQTEWIDSTTEKYRLVNENKSQRRCKTIKEADEESEAEFEGMEESDDESGDNDKDDAYAQEESEEDDDNDQWLVTDDESDQGVSSKKRKAVVKHTPRKKVLSVTKHTKGTSPVLGVAVNKTPPPSRLTSTKSTSPTPVITPASKCLSSSSSPTPYVKNALNPAGSHVHNHLAFLQCPRDVAGRDPSHPHYDPRTLKVDVMEWEKHAKMTDAVKQWWDIKSQYFDTVLLFKTGKFYEMFHMDADVGVQVLGLTYMKGHMAHAGFPEISYGVMADRLVRAGYKVARVEQTETPDQLKERKKKKTRGPAPKVVNREVCSIMTLGTRTFCYLDDESGISSGMVDAAVGPLLSIREVLLDESLTSDDDEYLQPVCEYGITLVDAVRGEVTIGQFADDVLRSRLNTLLVTFRPSEILLQGGEESASPTMQSLIRSIQTTSQHLIRVETISTTENFPKSTALDAEVRNQLERQPTVRPWDVEETLRELHRRQYYPRGSMVKDDSISRWPHVLRAAVEGNAELALASFGAALYYLQRNLIDSEILSMGIVKAYVPPSSSTAGKDSPSAIPFSQEDDIEDPKVCNLHLGGARLDVAPTVAAEDAINHLALDGTTLHNLEILFNSADYKPTGSLWEKLNHTKTPHGSRLLRAWLLRPLFKKSDIDRRADAVEELFCGASSRVLQEATAVLAKCGDIERLLSRVHSMSHTVSVENESTGPIHPSERAVLYESATYTKRKVGDFSKVLHGLRHACQIPEIFDNIEIESGLLKKVVRLTHQGGCFPDMKAELDWFFDNFDCEKAAKGIFEPSRGIDDAYDEACDTVARIENDLIAYKEDMCARTLSPRAIARSSWRYINTTADSKDKYLIELPASVAVPDDFILKGKRGSGHKQINKYRTAIVDELVLCLDKALETQKARKSRGMQLIFAKFDAQRNNWAAAAQATAMLDALGSLAHIASLPGYTRPRILNCPSDSSPSIRIVDGRHPSVEDTFKATQFIPNNLSLGCDQSSRILLLSGPNMGGKSTLLRQTCLIAILAQIGSYVPATECELTPMDRIYTRLGACDRLLLGQSTFFVELAETAAALRGATRRSLVIMDELGRGTSTFDGTAIASACVQHLIEQNYCLALFATHYHTLLDEWKGHPYVRLGHMECAVEYSKKSAEEIDFNENKITFLYTLGDGACPKSFGINVARLAGLPGDVLQKAKRISSTFELESNGDVDGSHIYAKNASQRKQRAREAIEQGNWSIVWQLWKGMD